MRSASKVWVMDDRGELRSTKRGLCFVGDKQQFLLADVGQVRLQRQWYPWKTWLLADAILIALWGLRLVIGLAEGKVVGWEQAAARFAGFLVLLIIVNVFGYLITLRQKWVRVDHRDQTGQRRVSFFAVSTLKGWGGLLGEGARRRLLSALASAQQGEAAEILVFEED